MMKPIEALIQLDLREWTYVVNESKTGGYGELAAGWFHTYIKRQAIVLDQKAQATIAIGQRFFGIFGAAFMNIDGDVGSVAVGKRADLILVDGDLMADASAIRRMPLIFKKGIGFDSAKIFAAMKDTVGLH